MDEGNLPKEEKDLLNLYKEKIFDKEIRFVGNLEEAINSVWSEQTDLAFLQEICIKMEIDNLRTIQRIISATNELTDKFTKVYEKELPKDLTEQLYLISAIAGASFYDGYVPIDFLKKYKDSDYINRVNQETKNTPEQTAYDKYRAKLKDLGYGDTDDIDLAVINYYSNSYINQDNLTKALQNFQKSHKEKIESQNLRAAWDLLYSSFHNNAAEVADDINRATLAKIANTHIETLDSVVRLLREIGFSQDADKLIAAYFDKHTQYPDRISESIKDAEINQKLKHLKELEDIDNRPLAEVIHDVVAPKGHNMRNLLRLNMFSENDYVCFFQEHKSEDFVLQVAKLVKFQEHGDAETEQLFIKTKEKILNSIEKCPINNLRIHGIMGLK
jgi:hypothetical protein